MAHRIQAVGGHPVDMKAITDAATAAMSAMITGGIEGGLGPKEAAEGWVYFIQTAVDELDEGLTVVPKETE